MSNFQKRINYQGNLKHVFKKVCEDFSIGRYQSHITVSIGYEDFNLIVKTDKGNFFVKIFGAFRNTDECQRYVNIIKHALDAGVSHPKLYESNQGLLYQLTSGSVDRLIVMEYIDGKTFYQLQTMPTVQEIKFIVKQVTLINTINLKPSLVYDHWAIVNLLKEYEEKKKYLSKEDNKFIEPLVKKFGSLPIQKLPHCFVQGDITKTNTMKSDKGNIYILDFAVANWYPRIQELAVLLCDLFFNPNKTESFLDIYELVLSEYQKYILLTSDEISLLPLYVKLAHVMHVLLANYEKVQNGSTSTENEYFLNIGREGLRFTNNIWKQE